MAYVPQQQTPEQEQNKFGLTSPTTPNPVPPQTGGSAGTSQGGGGAAPGVGTSTQFGSNASKLSDYLTANQDQAENFGNQVAGNLNQGYQSAVGAIDTGFGNFNNQVNGSYTPPNQDLVNQAGENPSEFVKNPGNVSQFKSLYNDSYQGPNNFESTQPYSDINNQVNQAVSNAGLTKTQGGLGTYLNNSMGGKDTTQGMQTLDTALLMGNPNSAKAIQAASAPYSGLNDYLAQKTSTANTGVQNAKQIADQTRMATQNKVNGPNGIIENYKNSLNNELTNATNKSNDFNSKELSIQDKIANGQQLTQDEMNFVGMNPYYMGGNGNPNDPGNLPTALTNFYSELQGRSDQNSPQKIKDVLANRINSLNPYLTHGTLNTSLPTMPGIATQQDIDEENALRTLLGSQNEIGFSPGGDSYRRDGTRPIFNQNKYGTDIANQLNSVKPYLTPTDPQWQKLEGILRQGGYINQPTQPGTTFGFVS